MDILTHLLAKVSQVCEAFPDSRSGNGNAIYSMHDIGMSAFSMFFMQSPSFLHFQRSLEKGHHTSNCQTLFGMKKVPTDNHIRSMLDSVHPSHLQPCFDAIVDYMQEKALHTCFSRLNGRILIALDGTEYFTSKKINCPHCQNREHKNGSIDYYHSALSACIVAPGHNSVIPLMPECIHPQDGHEKQDCEREAAKRWIIQHSQSVSSLKPIYLGDDLFSCEPITQLIIHNKADFIFTCKEKSHKTLYSFISGAELETLSVRTKKGKNTNKTTYKWIENVPIKDGKEVLHVNWIEVNIEDANGKITYRNTFMTSLLVSRENVAEIVSCARARWKIENESFNILKNNGYEIEHNFGHGKKYLAQIFLVMNCLSFAIHSLCDCIDEAWKNARKTAGTRKEFFSSMKSLVKYFIFPSWKTLLKTIADDELPIGYQNLKIE